MCCLRSDSRLLHHSEPVVLSTSDAYDTVTDNCDLLCLALLIRENILDEFDRFVVSFELIKVLPIKLSLSAPDEP